MEITANAAQNVAANQNVLFTETAVAGNCSIIHREGSGLITLKGNTQQCRARYKVFFSANLGVPTGGTPDTTSLAIAICGEPIPAATMIAPSMTAGDTINVSTMILIDVPKGCCQQISVKNLSGFTALISNANLIIERIA